MNTTKDIVVKMDQCHWIPLRSIKAYWVTVKLAIYTRACLRSYIGNLGPLELKLDQELLKTTIVH